MSRDCAYLEFSWLCAIDLGRVWFFRDCDRRPGTVECEWMRTIASGLAACVKRRSCGRHEFGPYCVQLGAEHSVQRICDEYLSVSRRGD